MSEVFLNMKMEQPSYIKDGKEESKEDMEARAEDEQKDGDVDGDGDGDDDFERDLDGDEDPIVQEVKKAAQMEESEVRDDEDEPNAGEDEDSSDKKMIKRNKNTVKVNVKINISNLETKKKPKFNNFMDKKSSSVSKPAMSNMLLDILFSFIGVSS